jgi:hypothetical protein
VQIESRLFQTISVTSPLFCLHYESDKLKIKIPAFAEPKAADVIHAKGEQSLEQDHLSVTSYTSHDQKHPILLIVIDLLT